MAGVAAAEFRRGWTVIVAAAVGVGLGITGLPIYTTGQFILPLHMAFGWSRSAVSGGLLCLTTTSVLMAPIIGWLTERFGVRPVALASILGMALGYIGLTLHGGSVALYDAAWVVLAVLGAGTSPIVWSRAVASWFDRGRGLALGLTLCGTGLVAMIAPGAIGSVIARFGWQAGFQVLAAAQILLSLPLVALLFRARPVDDAPVQPIAWRSTLRGGIFWRLGLAFLLIAIEVGGMIVHLPAMLADADVPRAVAASALGLLGVSIIVGRLMIGVLMDRLPARLVAPVFILLPVLSCLLLARLTLAGEAAVTAAVVLAGLSTGAEVDMLAYLVSRYFPIAHYTRIYGWILAAFSAGVGLGPIFAGWVHDRTGSYGPALAVFAGFLALAAALVASLGQSETEFL